MTVTDKQATEWASEESRRTTSRHRSWDEDRSREFEFIAKVLSKPSIIDDLEPDRRERLVWNIPWIYGETNRKSGYERHRIHLASAFPGFVEHVYGNVTEESVSLEMFWDIAISGIDNADRPLVDTVFDSLVRQLAIPNEWCQSSAIHGFNHLKEPRCRPILREFAKTCDDPGLAEYARNAMTFQMM